MANSNAYDLQFLESADNVRGVIAHARGRVPNAELARTIAVCIQQGRMFFESAAEASLEIRPLPLYYGVMAFSKAIICGVRLQALATLAQAHGLRDVSAPQARVSDLVVQTQDRGTFLELNDVICVKQGIKYFEGSMSRRYAIPTASSANLGQGKFTLKDILARIPALKDLFEATFPEKAEICPFLLHEYGRPDELVKLRVDLRELFDDVPSLAVIVEDLRAKFPALRRWSFEGATKAWDNSIIEFANVAPVQDEFEPAHIEVRANGTIEARAQNAAYLDFRTLLDPVAGGFTDPYPALLSPIGGAYVSDISLQYAGIFLLSSLVRYRPQTWVHAVSRFATQNRPADDQALALIERFLGVVQQTFPSLAKGLLSGSY